MKSNDVQKQLFSGSKSEYFLAQLLESDSEVTKTLVAECDGEVVGFISFSLMINQKRLSKIFDLDAYSNLNAAGSEEEVTDGATAATAHNTFCISLFSIDDKFASQSYDLVKTAFQVLPDYEYCILTTEPTGQDPPLWRHFTQIRPREGQTAP